MGNRKRRVHFKAKLVGIDGAKAHEVAGVFAGTGVKECVRIGNHPARMQVLLLDDRKWKGAGFTVEKTEDVIGKIALLEKRRKGFPREAVQHARTAHDKDLTISQMMIKGFARAEVMQVMLDTFAAIIRQISNGISGQTSE